MRTAILIVTTLSLLPVTAAAQKAPSFESLDVSGNGTLSKLELIGNLPGIAAGFDIADRSNDGRLSRPEFDEAMALSASMYGEDERSAHKREIFRSLDMDGDRAISKDEAQWRREIASNFAAADRDRDGKLGLSEFGLISIYTLATRGENAAEGASARTVR